MNNTILTNHVRFERCERLSAIIAEIGLGAVAYERELLYHGRAITQKVTTTGVMLVYGVEENKDVLITGFLLSTQKAHAFFRGIGYTRIPRGMYGIVTKNEKIYAHMYYM